MIYSRVSLVDRDPGTCFLFSHRNHEATNGLTDRKIKLVFAENGLAGNDQQKSPHDSVAKPYPPRAVKSVGTLGMF